MEGLLVLLLGAVLLALAGPVAAGSFDAKRVHVIDQAHSGKSVLFRGSMPREGDQFAYSELLSVMRKVAKAQSGIDLPESDDDIFIEDVSLLSYEVSDWDLEKKFFEKNPKKGHFTLYPIIGQFLEPKLVPQALREKMAKDLRDWQIDDLPKTMSFLNTMLLTAPPTNKTRVIYVHCEAGEDRTGEVSGSYYIRFLKWSFARALNYDDHIESRHIHIESQNAFQWYCYYLKYTHGPFAGLDCVIPKNDTLTH